MNKPNVTIHGANALARQLYSNIIMLWTIIGVLFVLWIFGFALHVAGALIHLLLVIAVVLLLVRLISGRRVT